jgi:hypothetical protein
MESRPAADIVSVAPGQQGAGELTALWHYAHPLLRLPEPGTRIGVTGAQGVGKTVLAGLLSRALGLPLLSEISRSASRNGLPLGSATTLGAQAAMWFAQFDLESRHPSYVADRTLLDVVAHSAYASRRAVRATGRLFVTALRNATGMAALGHYHLLVYVPIEFPLPSDGLRDTSTEFQKFIDEAMRAALDGVPVPRVEVSGSPPQRLAQVLRAVDLVRRDVG